MRKMQFSAPLPVVSRLPKHLVYLLEGQNGSIIPFDGELEEVMNEKNELDTSALDDDNSCFIDEKIIDLNSGLLNASGLQLLAHHNLNGFLIVNPSNCKRKVGNFERLYNLKYIGTTLGFSQINITLGPETTAILCLRSLVGSLTPDVIPSIIPTLIPQICNQILDIDPDVTVGVGLFAQKNGAALRDIDFGLHFSMVESDLDKDQPKEEGYQFGYGGYDMSAEATSPHLSSSESFDESSDDSFLLESVDYYSGQHKSLRRTSSSHWRHSKNQKGTIWRLGKGGHSSSDNEASPIKYKGRENRKKRCSRGSKRKSKRKSPVKENISEEVVLVSDEEDETPPYPKPVTNVFQKEPTLKELSTYREPMTGGGEVERMLDAPDTESIKLGCRTVRFGSFKMVPQDRIFISEHGLKIALPGLSSKKSAHTIKIMMHDICKVLIHFGKSGTISSEPVIFYYVNVSAGTRIRQSLNKMTEEQEEIYFDPTSKDELHKRITLLPENISQADRLFLKAIYDTRCLLEELTWDEANDILVRAAPKEVQHMVKKEPKSMPSDNNEGKIQIIMVYPPPPYKGGLPINTEDYACLKADQFLNDVIIDFYLKYLYLNMLSEEDKKRTHMFSSFFYRRLTTKVPKPNQEKLTTAERRHSRVKSWTKSVDIFDKDFIIIPINEQHHWYLGIICFPGLTGPVRMSDNTPIDADPKLKNASVLSGGQAPAKIWGTTISIVKPSRSVSVYESEDCDDSERDEAEGDEDDMEPNTSDEDTGNIDDLMDEATPRVSTTKHHKPLEPIKQPCILIFDSLATSGRPKVCATLREYLEVEWKVRNKGKPRDFSKNVFKGAMPKVPQQTNFIDCGVYVLQYVESFFKNPIMDYNMPIRSIKNWFTTQEVSSKRYKIQQLLLRLMEEQNVDIANLHLPNLNLGPYAHSFDDDEDEGGYEDDNMIDHGEMNMEEEEAEPEVEEEEEEEMEDDDDDDYDDDQQHGTYGNMEEVYGRSKHHNPRERLHSDSVRKIEISSSTSLLRIDPHSRLEKIDTFPSTSGNVRVEPQARIERVEPSSSSSNIRIEPISRVIESSPRHSPRRFETPSPRPETVRTTVSATKTETPLRARLPDSVTICEANSKRKLPLSLKDIRNPRQSSISSSSNQQQATIEKIKRPKYD